METNRSPQEAISQSSNTNIVYSNFKNPEGLLHVLFDAAQSLSYSTFSDRLAVKGSLALSTYANSPNYIRHTRNLNVEFQGRKQLPELIEELPTLMTTYSISGITYKQLKKRNRSEMKASLSESLLIQAHLPNGEYYSFSFDISTSSIIPIFNKLTLTLGNKNYDVQVVEAESILVDKILSFSKPIIRTRVRDVFDLYIFSQNNLVDLEKVNIYAEDRKIYNRQHIQHQGLRKDVQELLALSWNTLEVVGVVPSFSVVLQEVLTFSTPIIKSFSEKMISELKAELNLQ